jgi:hypothetical protein
VKRIAETPGVSGSDLVERAIGKRPRRDPQTRTGDAEITADLRRLVDGRPTFGYRRNLPLSARVHHSISTCRIEVMKIFAVDIELYGVTAS